MMNQPAKRRKKPSLSERYASADMLSAEVAGATICRSPAYIYDLVASGALPACKVGGYIRIKREEWIKWRKSNTVDLLV